ncbi:hypothetical protein Nepgr_001567 [Nepenthes gracilis]|uniref:SANT domain-containing protein n=1 Tax=Nepenthes gracilis TaxID=150966 RepID=A0AAD3P5C2_NEPGR|nr:hypothetical protein Nepgr_001567 [Nepenthes gracilis]
MHPRIGDEYQVQIPPMLTDSECLQLLTNPAESKVMGNVSHSFLIGLPVSVTWVYNEVKFIKDEHVELPCNQADAAYPNEFVISKNVTKRQSSFNDKDQNLKFHLDDQMSMHNGYNPVPGLSADSWSDFEVGCFLLGLYIFGKNLLQVKLFMESKEMGQILAFYYGRFYRSHGYCRWSDCRKTRNKKCVLGQKIFMGCRQQELFSRLLPRLSEESKNSLQEAYKVFVEGGASFEDYVITLKKMVGIRALVEAVGLGKGKDDLTTLAVEASKTSHMFHFRPEIPSGKACSSLSCADIIKFLTGDFRLSKARSNDLFWEAVWPRLLAKGWHSEQPNSDGYTGSKNCLVFLMPGIKKFSRKKLVKGDHYFDSVSDVLSKVASEPELLEMDDGETGASSSKVKNGWATKVNSDDDGDASDHQRHCYLKPRVSATSGNLMKFTVVDTSLLHAEKPSKIRELRSLPVETKSFSALRNRSRAIEVSLSGNFPLNSQQNSLISTHNEVLSNGCHGNQRMQSHNLVPPKRLLENEGITSLSTDLQLRPIKHQFRRRSKSGQSNYLGPALKRPRLTACTEEIFSVSSSIVELEESFSNLSLPSGKKDAGSKAGRFLRKASSVNSAAAASSHEKSGDCANSDIYREQDDRPKAPEFIDLNLPQVLTESKSSGQLEVEAEGMQCHKKEFIEGSGAADVPQKEQQLPTAGSRRQSTRNRPLTTKALEALEIGLLNPRQTRKRRPNWAQEQRSRPSSRLHVRSTKSADCSNDSDATEYAATQLCNGRAETLTHPLFQTEKEAASELLGISKAPNYSEGS